MIKRIVFLMQQYFTERDYQRFGIDLLQKNGFEVLIWDLGKLIYPQTIDGLIASSGVFEATSIKRYNKLADVVHDIHNQSEDTFFISTIPYRFNTIKIFYAISRSKSSYGCTGTYTLGIFPKINNNTVKNHFRFKSVFIITNKLKSKLLEILFIILRIERAKYFAIIGGKKLSAGGPLVDKNTFLHYIHSFDYDRYLLNKSVDNSAQGNIVFIDQFIPRHPDNLLKAGFIVDETSYYKELNDYFSFIETKLGKQVIIAAHPKSDYSYQNNPFCGREIVRGVNSLQEISTSSLVLAHFSMAITLAVIYHRPLFFLTSKSIKILGKDQIVERLSSILGSCLINISSSEYPFSQPNISNEIYDKYKADYIKHPDSPDKLFWEQVSDYIKSSI